MREAAARLSEEGNDCADFGRLSQTSSAGSTCALLQHQDEQAASSTPMNGSNEQRKRTTPPTAAPDGAVGGVYRTALSLGEDRDATIDSYRWHTAKMVRNFSIMSD